MHLNLCRSLSLWFALVIVAPVFAAEPVLIATGAGDLAPKQPQAAVAADGIVHLVYGVKDSVFHCRSTDGGGTFSKPKAGFAVANLSLGMRRGPRLVVTPDALVVTAIGGLQGKGRDGDLQAWRSTDDGVTWVGPVRVNDTPDSAREGLHGMASGADGSVWCVWLDLRQKQSEVYAAQSLDGGLTWKANVLVYRSPGGSVCECCHPSVVVAEGVVHVMFRNLLAGNRDMYVTSSEDGETFTPAKKVGQGTWKIDGCPMDGGMLATGPHESLITVWQRNGQVFSAASTGGKERLLGAGELPWVASHASGPVFVWTAGRDRELCVRTPQAKQHLSLSAGASNPMVAATAKADSPVVVCWESQRAGQAAVLVARLEINPPKSR